MWQYPQTEMLWKGSGKEVEIQEFMYRDTTNVEPEMYDYTSNNWSHWNSNEKLKENLEAVPGKHSIDSLRKTSILGTSHIIRKVLQCEAWSLSGGDYCWFNKITRKNRPVTRDIIIIIILANTATFYCNKKCFLVKCHFFLRKATASYVINHLAITNKMRTCIRIYYSKVSYCPTCFERHISHHKELKNCICSLWFYIRLWLPATVKRPTLYVALFGIHTPTRTY